MLTRFWLESREPSESFQNISERLAASLGRWERAAGGSELRDLVLLEKFLQALPREIAVRFREGKPNTMKEAAEAADGYELAHMAGWSRPPRQHQLPEVTTVNPAPPGTGPSNTNRAAFRSFQQRGGVELRRSKSNLMGDILCWGCGKYGPVAVNCPNRKGPGMQRLTADQS